MDDDKREYTKRVSFEEYRLLLMNELERLGRDVREVNRMVEQFRREDVAQMKTDIALLKFQAVLWGSVAGFVSTGIVYLAVKLIHV